MYAVALSREAARFFNNAEAALQRRLDRCFDALRINPFQHPNIKRLHGDWAGALRFRLGDYRVIYRVDAAAQLVRVLVIAHRREVYE